MLSRSRKAPGSRTRNGGACWHPTSQPVRLARGADQQHRGILRIVRRAKVEFDDQVLIDIIGVDSSYLSNWKCRANSRPAVR